MRYSEQLNSLIACGVNRMRSLLHAATSKQKDLSLKRKTWQFFLIVLSLFCVIFITSYSIIMMRSAVDNEVSSSEIALTGISKNISVSLERYKEMSRLIMLNSDVMDFLRDSGNHKVYNATTVRNGIFSVTHIYSYVDSVYVYRTDGEYVSTGSGVMYVDEELVASEGWTAPLSEAKGGSVVMINGNGAFRKKIGTQLITMARYIYDINTQQITGMLVVNLTPGVLYAATRDINKDRPICFLDEEGHVLWGDESMKEYFNPGLVDGGFHWEEKTTGGQRQVLSAYSEEGMPLVLVSLTGVSSTGFQSWESIWIIVTLVAAVVLSVFGSGVFISANIARPIDMLSEAITSTKANGELHKIDLPLPNNEIRRLADSYNSMIAHIHELIDQLIEKEKSIQKAEIRTLHEQIKPHFLYNSLETISYMALQSDAPQVHDALETLGSFYRNFLSKGSRDIPLRNEIMIVKDYLALQKLRYGEIFDDEYVLDERILGTLIPKLILQPLVENSLYHGVRLKGEKGVIRISAFEKDGTVHVTVYDTGLGMTQEKIDEVLSGDAADENALTGFGLKGTIERIRYYCNNRDVISIRSEPGEYTEIEIVIPKQK